MTATANRPKRLFGRRKAMTLAGASVVGAATLTPVMGMQSAEAAVRTGPFGKVKVPNIGNGGDDSKKINEVLAEARQIAETLSGQIAQGAAVQLEPGIYRVDEPLRVPRSVRLIGSGIRNTVLVARDSMPYIVELGSGERIASGSTVEHLSLNGDNIPGVKGVYSQSANEHSGVMNCRTLRCRGGGIEFKWVNGGQVGAPHNWTINGYDDIIDEADDGRIVISLVGPSSTSGYEIARVTSYSADPVGARNVVGIRQQGLQAPVRNSHLESCDVGVMFTHADMARIDSLTGNQSTVDLVHILRNMAGKTVMLTGLERQGTSGRTIADAVNANSISTDVAMYGFSPASEGTVTTI